MNRHLLFELAYMFYRIGTYVIHRERRLVKTSRKLCLFYSPSKGGLRNLAQSLLHDLSSYPPSQTNFFSSFCESVPLHKNRIHWVEFLSIPCNWHLLHHWKKHQSLKGFAFVVHDEVSFLGLQFLVANPFHQLACVPSDSFVDSHFYQHGSSASCPLAGYLRDFPVQGYGAHLIDER